MAKEWSELAYEPKALRVKNPVNDQRSTRRLQLRYRHGTPLTVSSRTLQWLVSWSVFLARVAVLDNGVQDTSPSISYM